MTKHYCEGQEKRILSTKRTACAKALEQERAWHCLATKGHCAKEPKSQKDVESSTRLSKKEF